MPKTDSDYGDGGAYPEINLLQYPRQMGGHAVETNGCLPIDVNIDGNIKYNCLLTCNKRWTQSTTGILPGKSSTRNHKLIDADVESTKSQFDSEVKETMSLLKNRIDSLTNQRGSAKYQSPEPFFITYTPKNVNHVWNGRTCERLLQIQEMIPDPVEPPKHKIMKVPRGSSREPVPVMHSPPNGVEYREALNWKIPPAISNWKNAKGYIIALDKRLAVDGTTLKEVKINDNFGKLSEALYVAEGKAREETELRNWVAKENSIRQKERKNAEMRALALKARFRDINENSEFSLAKDKNINKQSNGYNTNLKVNKNDENVLQSEIRRVAAEERKLLRSRNDIRKHHKHLRDRERRMSDAGEHGYRRSKVTRDNDRDICERLALGEIKA
eukprot:gnl/MRDRNA2_/MRDRNA2_81591_c0_seq1.p1 gnl/MRDRNA2_/MRDRNA2_81591_c0~~gnl/MRDRNA2_/MRDRNA2_81591_c0_seq1.p1  ORF type:complete len:386 (-),score=32.52 gnl/MRDRNA2_/MRDRNA2_81591_c0_seq1:119-1276(-)